MSHLINQCALENNDREDESNFHHDFNPSATMSGIRRFEALFDFISMIGKPLASKRMCNIVTGVEINQDVVFKALDCIEFGDADYQEFVSSRLDRKETGLHETVCANINYLLPPSVAP